MSDILYMKQGDLAPPLTAVCKQDGVPVNLTSATSVIVRVSESPDTTPIVEAAATRSNQTTNPGEVTYQWVAGETDNPGTYNIEVEVVWPSNRPQTFPAHGYETLIIDEDLDA